MQGGILYMRKTFAQIDLPQVTSSLLLIECHNLSARNTEPD